MPDDQTNNPTNKPLNNPDDADRSERIIELYSTALELPPEERAAFLAEACAGDEALRREIEELLSYKVSAEDWAIFGLGTSAIALAARQMAEEQKRDSQHQQILAGTVISHYRILKPLGAGGMGEVYLAEDLHLQRRVALKFLAKDFAADAERVRRFEREALTVSKLQHANIVTIYEHFSHDGRHVIATEFVEGETLRKRLRRGALDWREVTRIALQVAAALNAAHAAGVIHRDIKPENVMLQEGGFIKVLDFGIAKHVGQAEQTEVCSTPVADGSEQTLTGLQFYTLGYASPEQVQSDAAIKPDARTDIFSLGVLMFELLTGERPFAGATLQDWIAALLKDDEAPDVRTHCPLVPAALAAIIAKALWKSREERYDKASEMLADLEGLRNDLAVNETGEQIVTQSANRLLTQFTILSLNQPQTRIPLGKLWTAWWVADLPRGKPEKMLLRKSLRSGLLRFGAWALVIVSVTIVFAAWMSISERWEERVLRDGHAAAVRQLAIAPDGHKLVSVGNDAKIIVWDFARRERLATLTHNDKNPVSAVTFSPDGRWFATSCSDGTVIVWEAGRFGKAAVLPSHHGGVDMIAFTPDGRLLITRTGQDQQNLWEVGSWRKVGELPTPGLRTGSFLVSPDSRRLLGQTWDAWDLASGEKVAQGSKPVWTWSALSPDAGQLATVDGGGFAGFWDVSRFWNTGERRLINRQLAHRERGRAVAYAPDGRLVATGGENIILWDARTRAKLGRFDYTDRVSSLAFAPDGQSLIAAYGDGEILIWDVQEKEQRASFGGHCRPVRAVSFAPDGKLVASAGDDGSVIVWDTIPGGTKMVLSGYRTRVSDIAFSADGKQLAATDLYGKTIIWGLGKGTPLLTIPSPERDDDKFVYCLAISPDDRWVATGGGIYATADGRMVLNLLPRSDYPFKSEIYDLAFARNGRWLAGVTPFGEVFLWEVDTWNVHQTPKQPGKQLISVAFSPDSKWLVTGEDQGAVRLWQTEPLREMAVLGRHTSYVRSVAFSHDGQRVASASDDQTIAIWDIARRKRSVQVGTHTSPALAIAFSPDDYHLISGEYDKSVRLYTRHRTLWGWRLD